MTQPPGNEPGATDEQPAHGNWPMGAQPAPPSSPPPIAPPGSPQQGSHQSGAPLQPAPGTPPAEQPQQQRGSRAKAAVITGIIVAVVSFPLGFIASEMREDPSHFNRGAMESEVERVLIDDYGLHDVSDVRCPSGVAPQQGTVFECEFMLGQSLQSVTVTVSSEHGDVLVGSPLQ